MPRHVVSGFLESVRPSWDSGVLATQGIVLLLSLFIIVCLGLKLARLLLFRPSWFFSGLLSFDFLLFFFFFFLFFFFLCSPPVPI